MSFRTCKINGILLSSEISIIILISNGIKFISILSINIYISISATFTCIQSHQFLKLSWGLFATQKLKGIFAILSFFFLNLCHFLLFFWFDFSLYYLQKCRVCTDTVWQLRYLKGSTRQFNLFFDHTIFHFDV